MACKLVFYCFFFFNDTATTEIYTLSLHDALPICARAAGARRARAPRRPRRHPRARLRDCGGGEDARRRARPRARALRDAERKRSEAHTSQLQSQSNLVRRPPPQQKKLISGLC